MIPIDPDFLMQHADKVCLFVSDFLKKVMAEQD